MPTRPRPTPQADPLADLRGPTTDTPGLTTPPATPPVEPPPADDQETVLEVGTVYDAAWHEDAIRAVVRRWHGDRTATRMVHKGQCPCAYLARLALLEAVGMTLPPAPEPLPVPEVKPDGDPD